MFCCITEPSFQPWDNISLGSPGWLGTQYADEVHFKLVVLCLYHMTCFLSAKIAGMHHCTWYQVSFHFLKDYLCVYMCVLMCSHACMYTCVRYLTEARRRCCVPCSWSCKGLWVAWHGSWGLKLGLLKESYMLSISQSSNYQSYVIYVMKGSF